MGLLYDLSTKYKTLSIVGMAKNAGKTTALNYLIEEAIDEGVMLGITSTGRDGETQDLVTGTEKPRVYLDQDMLVAVPTLLYDLADAGLEVIRKTKYSTAIGELLICRVREAGYVQIAGPVINAEQKMLCDDMLGLGCQLILIDGAIDRKSIASPDTSDAIILSTGAVLSRKLNKVVEETAHVVNLYRTPELEEGVVRKAIEDNNSDNKIMLVDGDGKVTKLDLATGLGAAKEINGAIDEDTRYIYSGSFYQQCYFRHKPEESQTGSVRAQGSDQDFRERYGLGHFQKERLPRKRSEKHRYSRHHGQSVGSGGIHL